MDDIGDGAQLLHQLQDAIHETGECLNTLIPRRETLNSCIRLTEELHNQLHAAHATVTQRISFLSAQLEHRDRLQSDADLADIDGPRCARQCRGCSTQPSTYACMHMQSG